MQSNDGFLGIQFIAGIRFALDHTRISAIVQCRLRRRMRDSFRYLRSFLFSDDWPDCASFENVVTFR